MKTIAVFFEVGYMSLDMLLEMFIIIGRRDFGPKLLGSGIYFVLGNGITLAAFRAGGKLVCGL